MVISLFVILHAFTLLICHIYFTYFITGLDPVSELATLVTTTNMSVTWKAPSGQFDNYSVLLTRADQSAENLTRLMNTTLHILYENLNPGTLYNITVCVMSRNDSNCVATRNATCESIYFIFEILFPYLKEVSLMSELTLYVYTVYTCFLLASCCNPLNSSQ